MTFGEAIEALNRGEFVTRKGWNGKGMFLYKVPGSTVEAMGLRGQVFQAAKAAGLSLCDKIEILPHIDMKTADGALLCGWLASQTDILAEDWEILQNYK